jgi:23S rRNA pseudouridine1911/1915/1917 synthase
VPVLAAAKRLDVFLVDGGLARTRSQAKSWIDAGRVLVERAPRKAGFALSGGELIEIREAAAPPMRAEGEDLPLRVLYEDEEVLAIDKPAGMVVHPAPGSWRGTVVNALLHRRLVSSALGDERPGIVHRLDKETSGVLLVARTAQAQAALSRAFHDRRVRKTYQAIVLGVPRATHGVLEWTIGRHPRERKRMSIHSRSGRAARTVYRRLEGFGTLSLLEVEPETGRTHQIRVHLAALGHPVLGDPLYGARTGRARPPRGAGRDFPRQALHAAELEFPHPASGARIRIYAPLPSDMRALLEELRGARS